VSDRLLADFGAILSSAEHTGSASYLIESGSLLLLLDNSSAYASAAVYAELSQTSELHRLSANELARCFSTQAASMRAAVSELAATDTNLARGSG